MHKLMLFFIFSFIVAPAHAEIEIIGKEAYAREVRQRLIAQLRDETPRAIILLQRLQSNLLGVVRAPDSSSLLCGLNPLMASDFELLTKEISLTHDEQLDQVRDLLEDQMSKLEWRACSFFGSRGSIEKAADKGLKLTNDLIYLVNMYYLR